MAGPFTKTAVQVFAGTDAAGNARQVNNHDAQVWGTEVERAFSLFQAGGGVVFTSKAEADANLDYAANTMAWVTGDDADAGLYQKQGAAGSGSWVRVGDLPYSFIRAENVGAGTANAIQATTTMPIPQDDGGALISLPIAVDNTADAPTVSFNGGPALTITDAAGNPVGAGGLSAGMLINGYVVGDTFRADMGPRGWSPLLRVVNDGARRVLELYDWTGGHGAKPSETGYVGPSGLTSDIAQATDLRGPQGASGDGTGDMLKSEYDPSGLGMPISTFGDFLLFRLSDRESAVTLNLSAFEDVIVDRWSSSSLVAPARYRKVGSQPSHDAWFQDGAGNIFSMEEKMPLVTSFGAIGDGSSDDTDAIERANGYSRTVFFPIGDYLITRTITVGTTSKWIGTVPQSTNNQPGNRIWIEARIADIGDGNPLIKLTDPDVSAQSFVFQNLGFRGDMDPTAFNDLSTVSETGMVGVDISHVKNGLKFIDCYFRQLVCGAKQFDDSPYLDKTLFERCHFTRCYRGVSASPTGGLVFMNCEFDECVDFIDSTREVTLMGVRFNNTTFATENCQVSGRNIKVVGGYAEGGNNIFNPSASVSVDAFYSSVMHSASGERFLVKPQGNNVTVRFENTRIHSSNRLINFANVGDVRTISMDVNNNFDGTGLFGNDDNIQFYINQGLDYRGHGNLNSEAWNWSGPLRRGFNSSFTLGMADKEKLLVCTGGSGVTVTIPDSASVPFAVGTKIAIANWTGAPITVAINSDMLTHPLGRGSRTIDGDGYAEIIKIAATAWTIHGSGIS